jgi:hypothetical protein
VHKEILGQGSVEVGVGQAFGDRAHNLFDAQPIGRFAKVRGELAERRGVRGVAQLAAASLSLVARFPTHNV